MNVCAISCCAHRYKVESVISSLKVEREKKCPVCFNLGVGDPNDSLVNNIDRCCK